MKIWKHKMVRREDFRLTRKIKERVWNCWIGGEKSGPKPNENHFQKRRGFWHPHLITPKPKKRNVKVNIFRYQHHKNPTHTSFFHSTILFFYHFPCTNISILFLSWIWISYFQRPKTKLKLKKKKTSITSQILW